MSFATAAYTSLNPPLPAASPGCGIVGDELTHDPAHATERPEGSGLHEPTAQLMSLPSA